MKDIAAWFEYCKSLSPAMTEATAIASVSAGPGGLVKELGKAAPDWHFRHAFERGGWYRLGGVVNGHGEHISDNLESWAETALAECDGDFAELAHQLARQDLYATRLVGRTHYLVAPAGNDVADFLQLKIEDLQEVRGNRLLAGEQLPSSIEELIDLRQGESTLLPISLPYYSLRRLTHIGAFVGRMLAQQHQPGPIHRLLDDWKNSSAGNASVFHNHWVLALREHLDRYQQTIYRAQPIATLAGDPPEFGASSGTSGMPLYEALTTFDRAAGYPMAWYFHLLTSKAVPHWVAQVVVEDALAGFAYLPQRDIDVVRHWLHAPYVL